jgi:chemotaxis protein MotB
MRPSHDRWLVSYADLITLLFAVFVVLFAFSTQSRQPVGAVSSAIHLGFDALGVPPQKVQDKLARPSAAIPFAALAPVQKPPLAELKAQLNGIFGEAIARQEMTIEETPEGLVISLRELGFFNSGEARLLPGAEAKLEQAAGVLRQHDVGIRVEGHSDDQPIHTALYRSNWELSTARAMSVLAVLVNQGEFPPARVSLAGYGPYRPVESNETAAGRRMNRRVNLVVFPARTPATPLRSPSELQAPPSGTATAR